ncbi:predicted membrane protein [Reinekea sp. MED297]|uniref:Predicted membrane protein n=2 Tax=Reinekea TaxID=230494 RepID=A4BCI3_9GAMM|nr:predicted membrane protein [Reinekea sp. MED297] [Reinekea blandensis MED297]
MGAADAVPGVSGGTMALITGIYERFIAALAAFRPSLVQQLWRGEFRNVWQSIDGTFLLCVGSGILISLFSMLNLMHWLLTVCPPAVWAFFMGVILASLFFLVRNRDWSGADLLLLLVGLIIALLLITASGTEVTATPLTLFLGGALAISAMLLPGISGSFMLLLLGLYPVIVEAVHARELVTILWVALGCAAGILTVSRILQWALSRWHNAVISCMLGFVMGALVKVWPWQTDEGWYLPAEYASVTTESAWLGLSVLTFFVGIVVVSILHARSGK